MQWRPNLHSLSMRRSRRARAHTVRLRYREGARRVGAVLGAGVARLGARALLAALQLCERVVRGGRRGGRLGGLRLRGVAQRGAVELDASRIFGITLGRHRPPLLLPVLGSGQDA